VTQVRRPIGCPAIGQVSRSRVPISGVPISGVAVGGLPVARQVEALPLEEVRTDVDEEQDTDRPWLVIVWNDPINLMSFVTFVFQKLFGYSKEKATKLMLDVHHKGRAVVSSGTRERAELDVYRLHEHGLWATMEQST
jgi:ATP-dependent Clp protease adaptor protein ClpS